MTYAEDAESAPGYVPVELFDLAEGETMNTKTISVEVFDRPSETACFSGG